MYFLRPGAFLLLLMSSLYGTKNDKLNTYLALVTRCKPKKMSPIPQEVMTNHPEEFFNAALECYNTRQILAKLNKTVRPKDVPGSSTFAQLYNKKTKAPKGTSGNPFMDQLIKHDKFNLNFKP